MPVKLLNEPNLPAFDARLVVLHADTPRRWGALTPAAMLAHLQRTVEFSLEDRDLPDHSTLFGRTFLRWVALYAMPTRWPKGRVKAPAAALPTPLDDFDHQREALRQVMRQFVERADADPRRVVPHPIFGPLSLRQWRRFHGCHFDHHLRQFGV